jgi:hypothetical protein
MRKGIGTTEFWVGALAALITVVQQYVWPDKPFPTAEFTVLATWIGARLGEKALTAATNGGTANPGKRPWWTTEFWAAILFVVVRQFINLPAGIEETVMTYIIGRPVAKAAAPLISKITSGKS